MLHCYVFSQSCVCFDNSVKFRVSYRQRSLFDRKTKFARIGQVFTNPIQFFLTDKQNLPGMAKFSPTYDITHERTNKICQNWQISHKPMTLLMNREQNLQELANISQTYDKFSTLSHHSHTVYSNPHDKIY